MRTALFTGAGASKAIGYPLTNEILPRVRRWLKNGTLFSELLDDADDEAEDRRELRRYLRSLFPEFFRVPEKQLPLITDLFSLVDYAISSDEPLPIGGHHELMRCRKLLKQAITDVILDDYVTAWDPRRAEDRRQEKLLERLVSWIKERSDDIALITTNYDIGIEGGLYHSSNTDDLYQSVDLGFDWRHVEDGDIRMRPLKPALRVYKLHGSLDVLRCPNCGYLYFNPYGTIANVSFWKELVDDNRCHCHKVKLELHIVSPSFVREVRDASLQSIWRASFEWLREAEHWVIVGYSLPPEDLAIRSLLLRAYHAARRKPKVTVVQKNRNEISRYRLLFPNCTYKTGGLESFLSSI